MQNSYKMQPLVLTSWHEGAAPVSLWDSSHSALTAFLFAAASGGFASQPC